MSRKAAQDRRDRQRGGDHEGKGEDSLRRCLATGKSLPKWELLRFVADPDGHVVPDLGNELPGRGAWVSADAKALKKAIDKGLLKKALEAEVPAGLADLVESLLVKRVLGLLGFARRAGLVVGGFERVKEALDSHEMARAKVVAILEASDGAADGRRSVTAKAKAVAGDAVVCGLFNSDELSMALGASNVIHACLLSAGAGGLHARFLQEIGRMAGFRAMTPASWRGELTDDARDEDE